MMRLPTVQLGEVAEFQRRVVEASAIEDGTLYVGLDNIASGGQFVGVKSVENGELASAKFAFSRQHLLFGKLRPYLAKIARPTFDGVCSTDILPVVPGPTLERDYLAHVLLAPEMVRLAASRATGANLPRLSSQSLSELQIPLPSIVEQRRIARILDKADALRVKRRAAIAQLDALTQAIFLDMFGDPATNPKRWPVHEASEYVAEFQGGKSIEAEAGANVVTRHRVLKVSAVTRMIYDPSESKPAPDDYEPPREHFVRQGDLLFSRANTSALVGAVALVDQTPPNVLLPLAICLARPGSRRTCVYLVPFSDGCDSA